MPAAFGQHKTLTGWSGGDGFVLFGPSNNHPWAIFSPVLSQLIQGCLGQNGVTILAPLLGDPNIIRLLSICKFKTGGFTHSQSRGIRQHQDGLVLEILVTENRIGPRRDQKHRKFSLGPGIADLLHCPFRFSVVRYKNLRQPHRIGSSSDTCLSLSGKAGTL